MTNHNYLVHHGVRGQEWGVQNGPPYPLDAQDHSASEKKAGWRSSLQNPQESIKEKYKKTVRKKNEKVEEYRNKQSGFKKATKEILLSGAISSKTYDMARAAGESRVKSFLRAKADVGANTLINGASLITAEAIHKHVRTGNDFVDFSLSILPFVIGFGAKHAIQKSADKNDKNASLQQKHLTNKYYKDNNK